MPRHNIALKKDRTKDRNVLRSRSNPVILPTRKASQKRKQWTDADMRSTIDAVKGGEKILRAAKQYNVPQQTLQDKSIWESNSRV